MTLQKLFLWEMLQTNFGTNKQNQRSCGICYPKACMYYGVHQMKSA